MVLTFYTVTNLCTKKSQEEYQSFLTLFQNNAEQLIKLTEEHGGRLQENIDLGNSLEGDYLTTVEKLISRTESLLELAKATVDNDIVVQINFFNMASGFSVLSENTNEIEKEEVQVLTAINKASLHLRNIMETRFDIKSDTFSMNTREFNKMIEDSTKIYSEILSLD